MIQLAYTSLATEPMSEKDLFELLKHARKNNQALGITGILLYKSGSFFQVLEGEQENLEKLLLVIESDPRHEEISLLFHRDIEQRNFTDWSMGYANIDNDHYDLGHWDSANFTFPLKNHKGNFVDLVNVATAMKLVAAFS